MSNDVNGEMVSLARDYRGLTQKILAEQSQVSQSLIAKIEGAIARDVATDTLGKIALTLKFPTKFFYLDEEMVGFGSSSYYYRKKSRILASDRKRIAGMVNLHRICISRLLRSTDMQFDRTLPSFNIEKTTDRPSEIAQRVRAHWCLPEGPIRNMTRLMERAGVIVVPCDFGTEHMDGTTIHLNNCAPLVFYNKNMTGDRLRFTLAHELAHLVMHSDPSETMEDEADEFAGELLTPREEIRAHLRASGKITIPKLLELKPYWKVSAASLLVRADQLGLLTGGQKKYLWATMSSSGYKRTEPVDIPKESPVNHKGLIAYFTDNLGYSVRELASTVSMPEDLLYELYADCLPRKPSAPELRLVR